MAIVLSVHRKCPRNMAHSLHTAYVVCATHRSLFIPTVVESIWSRPKQSGKWLAWPLPVHMLQLTAALQGIVYRSSHHGCSLCRSPGSLLGS
jgi:hypothetical protein